MGAFQVVLVVKNLPAAGDTGDVGSISRLERSNGAGNGNPLQYPCLGNPMNRRSDGLQLVGLQRVGHDWSDLACTCIL